jgi:uncharacterized protein
MPPPNEEYAVKRPLPATSKRKARRKIPSYWLWVTILIASVAVTPWMLGPSCPQQIVIASGNESGGYYAFAKQYQKELAANGIELRIIATAGSVENQRLLCENKVDLAFVQGGIQHAAESSKLRSLASLYREPLWVFHRAEIGIQDLSDLKGRSIAIGNHGSGTRDLALQLLSDNKIGVRTSNVEQTSSTGFAKADRETRLLNMGGDEARQALLDGTVDVMFTVVSANSPIIEALLRDKRVSLLSIRHAATYSAKYKYLSTVTLPEGFYDLETNIPAAPVQLVSASANLVATDDLHPALVPLLLEVAEKCHHNGGVFENPGEFPNEQLVDFQIKESARRYFANGAPFFYRILPFQFAAWLDRVKLLILPLCTLLLPLAKLAPPIYRWSIRVKIYRWYRILREIDLRTVSQFDVGTIETDIDRLKVLVGELANVKVPLSYMEEFYNLRLHVGYVCHELTQRLHSHRNSTRLYSQDNAA